MRRTLQAVAWLVASALLAPAWAEPGPLAALQAQVDAQVQAGFERPESAAAALTALADQTSALPASAAEHRVVMLGRGMVAAAAGRAAQAETRAELLQARSGDPLAPADAALVRATLAETQGRVAEAELAAQRALGLYDAECPALPGCDYRSSWQALQLLARQGASRGHTVTARERALAAAELARVAGDAARQAWSLAAAAYLSAVLGDVAGEQRLFNRAQRLARLEGSPRSLARIRVSEMQLLLHHGDADGAQRAGNTGLLLARQARAPRLEALLLANLSDVHVKSGRPLAALQAVERALPIVRRHGDRRIARVLLHNAALAHVALGHTDPARLTLDELLAIHEASGAAGDRAIVLREFAEAFAGAGDLATALTLYHRERKLAAELMAANRETVLAELRERFDRDAQQRQLDQLARENRLMSAQLENRAAMQKVWAGGAVVLLLAAGVVALLFRRVREINRHLVRSRAVLSEQSRRDPLTGLANRRALHEHEAAAPQRPLVGALLLVDIDHFKHVNDGYGHAAGDVVLVEVARRLAEVVRDGDLVVRWGGEEFLILMPGVSTARAQALAGRVLQAVGGTPVLLPEGPLRVTVSVGYGSFPLPSARLPLPLERAVNLADMALYTAKNQGRNRAVGIAAVHAEDALALQQVEADFEQAWAEGRVSLLRDAGPEAPEGLATTAPVPFSTLAA